MFIWSTKSILSELTLHLETLVETLKQIDYKDSDSVERGILDSYKNLEKESIDFGLMEKSDHVFLKPAAFDWDDVGSWESIGKYFNADQDGNISIGNVTLVNCKNMLVYNLSEHDDMVATALDLDNQILVQTDDAVLSCPKQSAQRVKEIIAALRQKKQDQFL